MTRICGVLGQVRYLIVSFSDLCVLSYFTNAIATHDSAVVVCLVLFLFCVWWGVGVRTGLSTKGSDNYTHQPIAKRMQKCRVSNSCVTHSDGDRLIPGSYMYMYVGEITNLAICLYLE